MNRGATKGPGTSVKAPCFFNLCLIQHEICEKGASFAPCLTRFPECKVHFLLASWSEIVPKKIVSTFCSSIIKRVQIGNPMSVASWEHATAICAPLWWADCSSRAEEQRRGARPLWASFSTKRIGLAFCIWNEKASIPGAYWLHRRVGHYLRCTFTNAQSHITKCTSRLWFQIRSDTD